MFTGDRNEQWPLTGELEVYFRLKTKGKEMALGSRIQTWSSLEGEQGFLGALTEGDQIKELEGTSEWKSKTKSEVDT